MNDINRNKILQQWLTEPETQRGLNLCIQQAIENLKANTSLRVPRTREERSRAFSTWLSSCRRDFGPAIQEQFRVQFPGIAQKLRDPDTIKNIIEDKVWPSIETELRSYAVRGLASDWVRRHLGDAVLVGVPDVQDGIWKVPLAVTNSGDRLGCVVLDKDGDVLTPLTTSREALMKAIHDRRLPAVAAGSR